LRPGNEAPVTSAACEFDNFAIAQDLQLLSNFRINVVVVWKRSNESITLCENIAQRKVIIEALHNPQQHLLPGSKHDCRPRRE